MGMIIHLRIQDEPITSASPPVKNLPLGRRNVLWAQIPQNTHKPRIDFPRLVNGMFKLGGSTTRGRREIMARFATMSGIGLWVLLSCATAGASWWDRDGLEGSGDLTTEVRDVDEFSRLVVDCAFQVDIQFGDESRLELTFDDNLLEYVTTKVRGRRLILDCRREFDVEDACRVRITARQLTDVVVRGAADVRIIGFEGDEFTYELSGAGDLSIEGRVKELAVELRGAGSIDARDQIQALAAIGVDAFTIGTAAFEGSFSPGKAGLRAQIEDILAAA